MMLKNFATILSLCLLITTPAFAWLDNSSPLNQAHQKLLNSDLKGSFDSIVQVWQDSPELYVQTHLNQLLSKSLEVDCGKSLSDQPLAPWIYSIFIKRQSVQNAGRETTNAVVEIASSVETITNISFKRWPDTLISNESHFEQIAGDNRVTFRNTFELSQRLSNGLYRLEVTNSKNEVWSQWVVMSEPASDRVVKWDSKDTWAVDETNQLNPYCSLPVLTISFYDYIDEQYIRVFHRAYDSGYPATLPVSNLKPDRYVLAVGISNQRWQGPIIIEDQQVISKTHDLSSE